VPGREALWQPSGVIRHWWLLPVLIVLAVGAGAAAGYGLRDPVAQTGDDREETAATPTSATTARGDEPGPRAVELAEDVVADPDADAIQKLLQRHFDAINNRDYEAWRATVTRQRAAGFPKQQWLDQYQSTTDGAILVHRIEPTTTGSAVLISFTSIQDRTLAPDQQSDCVRWRVGYLVVVEQGELRLGPSEPAASQHSPC
jgi:hypothetical protein